MPRGASPKRERESKELVEQFGKSGRYAGRQKEVAGRIVNKQRAERGETKGEQAKARKQAPQQQKPAKAPPTAGAEQPIRGYDKLTVDDIVKRLNRMSGEQIQKVREYEQSHKRRKTLLEAIDRKQQ